MQALLERDTPALSVYNPAYYNNARNAGVVNSEVNALTKSWLDRLPPDAKAMVVDGGAAGDTAAVGVGFINSGFSVSVSLHLSTFRFAPIKKALSFGLTFLIFRHCIM